MNSQSWLTSIDLSPPAVVAVVIVCSAFWVGLLFEFLAAGRRLSILLSGLVAALALAAALLRPAQVELRGSLVGPRVVVLADNSRRLLLPTPAGETRRSRMTKGLAELRQHFRKAKLSVLAFGEEEPKPFSTKSMRLSQSSDLSRALDDLALGPAPDAIVVISDGRLSRPLLDGVKKSPAAPVLHSVALETEEIPDASIRAVRAAGAAVAHQPLALTVELGCSGGLSCDQVPVRVRELRRGNDPLTLASGTARFRQGRARLELAVTLERAGERVLEISMESLKGDRVPENDRRFITFSVARERLRLLHVAGRPTYDVRALRMWLKADESIDLVAFFILRTEGDNPNTRHDSELALIPFPVDELFSEHLPSFDAVILQDIDASRYKLAPHLESLASYVEAGGGLIMVGGPSSFSGGNYAGSALARVLPVTMDETRKPFDNGEFVPDVSAAGETVPILRNLRRLFDRGLPSFPGTNILGTARPQALVLWEHPRETAKGKKMPVLAIGEAGNGRAVALGLDGTFRLAWSPSAARAGGRGYGELWEGLLGWLMRDPRYEIARMELVTPCFADDETLLRVIPLPGTRGKLELTLEKLGGETIAKRSQELAETGPTLINVGKLAPGGYLALVKAGKAPPTRLDFACEKGGSAWADSRPDPRRLRKLAELHGGRFVTTDRIASLPLPASSSVAEARKVTALLPPWFWSLLAALAVGIHWLLRRRAGLV